MDQLESSHKDL